MLKPKVFISYAKEDSQIARRLYRDLKDEGIDLWLDEEELMPGQDWNREIKKAIEASTFFMPIISKVSMKKEGFTQRELKTALDYIDQKSKGGIYVIPVRVDDCQVNVSLQNYQFFDLFPSYHDGLQRLVRVLKSDIMSRSGRRWERK